MDRRSQSGLSATAFIVVLGLVVASLAWLVLVEGDGRQDSGEEVGADPAPRPEEPRRAGALMAGERAAPTAEVVARGSWDDRRSSMPVPITDHRIVDLQITSKDGQEWALTGAGLLDILAHELPDVPVRFRDEASLEAFRAVSWREAVPNRIHLGLLLMQCADLGFLVTFRDGALYVAPTEGGPPPEPADDR